MATAIATNTLRKHAPDTAVFFWHHIKPSHQWPMKFSNYLKTSLPRSSISPCVRRRGLCNEWLEFISKDMCLCCHGGENGKHTHTHAHPHFHSTAPQHCWYHTRLYGTPQHIYAQWHLAPAVAHCCKREWATCRELSLRLAPLIYRQRTPQSTELSQAKIHRCNS